MGSGRFPPPPPPSTVYCAARVLHMISISKIGQSCMTDCCIITPPYTKYHIESVLCHVHAPRDFGRRTNLNAFQLTQERPNPLSETTHVYLARCANSTSTSYASNKVHAPSRCGYQGARKGRATQARNVSRHSPTHPLSTPNNSTHTSLPQCYSLTQFSRSRDIAFEESYRHSTHSTQRTLLNTSTKNPGAGEQ